ncbi:hypothetical protein C5167_039090 [Papaver somniferum]|uniref:Calponin-homology (CH) domain-containing protein n=1 Tax=Papaver somniferum TaxID=3469 RepID=A0A4Y7IFE0_PAPSO|nr:hypothetical protein C5167_039090 [Papaver somniferum]
MSSFVGVVVSDPWLQSQFTQVELRSLKSKFVSQRTQSGKVTVGDLPPMVVGLKGLHAMFTVEEIAEILGESNSDKSEEIDFETFLRAYLNLQARATARRNERGDPRIGRSTTFLKSSSTTLLHTISETERASYVAHINNYLKDDKFLKNYLPLDPSNNSLFDLVKDGVLLCKLINVAVPGTVDERAINTKRKLNPWERNENHTLCLNSAKAIGCTVVNIGTQDLIEARPHLVLGLISQIIKIQLLADLNLKKTPQLVELVTDNKEVEELMSLAPEKLLLKWMNFHLSKAGYKKPITNFSTDLKDGEAYAYLLNVLAPEFCNPTTLETRDPIQRAQMVLDHAEKMNCKRYITPKDIVDGSTNLNLAFVAHIFHHRNGLTMDTNKISFAEMMLDDDQVSREERCFRLWINSLGTETYVNNVFEDVRTGWVLLEVLDKVSPGSVQWKKATKPPIRMPFRKVENCNQVVTIGKELNFSLVNVAGSDIDKNLSSGRFFLELLSAVEPRVVNWNLVTRGVTDEEKKLNATYIISVARKLGCSIFLLPEDIIEVNQKMLLTLTASIMYWSLQQPADSESSSVAETIPESPNAASPLSESSTPLSMDVSKMTIKEDASDTNTPKAEIENESPKSDS